MNMKARVLLILTIVMLGVVALWMTLTQAAMALKERGAYKIHACCTHAVLSGPAIDRIDASPIDSLIITNTIPLNDKANGCQKAVVLSIAELLGETIKRSHSSHSVSTLFV